jgi:hypothetical protein
MDIIKHIAIELETARLLYVDSALNNLFLIINAKIVTFLFF